MDRELFDQVSELMEEALFLMSDFSHEAPTAYSSLVDALDNFRSEVVIEDEEENSFPDEW